MHPFFNNRACALACWAGWWRMREVPTLLVAMDGRALQDRPLRCRAPSARDFVDGFTI